MKSRILINELEKGFRNFHTSFFVTVCASENACIKLR